MQANFTRFYSTDGSYVETSSNGTSIYYPSPYSEYYYGNSSYNDYNYTASQYKYVYYAENNTSYYYDGN